MPIRQYCCNCYSGFISSNNPPVTKRSHLRFHQLMLLIFPPDVPFAELDRQIDLAKLLDSRVPASFHLSLPRGQEILRKRSKQRAGGSVGSIGSGSWTLLSRLWIGSP